MNTHRGSRTMIEQEICFGIDGEEWVLNDNKKRHMCDNATSS